MQCKTKSTCFAPTVRTKQTTSEWSSWQFTVWSPWDRSQLRIRRRLLRTLSTNPHLRQVSLWSLRWRNLTETPGERGNSLPWSSHWNITSSRGRFSTSDKSEIRRRGSNYKHCQNPRTRKVKHRSKLIPTLLITQPETNHLQASRKRTTSQMVAGIVAAECATHVNNARRMERSVTNVPRLVISENYATPRKVRSHLKLDASHSTLVLQSRLPALKKRISSKLEFNPVEVRKKLSYQSCQWRHPTTLIL